MGARRMGTPVLLCLLLLGLYGTRVQAHGKHANRTRSGVQQQVDLGIQTPTGGALSALCVPKYAIDLILPPPMEVNSANRYQGPGCFDFSKTRPAYCPHDDYGNGYGGQAPEGYGPGPYGPEGYHAPEPYPKPYGWVHPSSTEEEEDSHQVEPAHKKKKEHDKHHWDGYDAKRDKPSGHHKPEKHHDTPAYDPSYGGPTYGEPPAHNGYPWVKPPPGSYPEQPHYPDHNYYQQPPPYSKYQEHYGDPAPECHVNSFKEYQISVKLHTQQSLPATAALLTELPGGGQCPTDTLGSTTVFAYGPTNRDGQGPLYGWPAFTIESVRYQPNRIQWTNELLDPATGNFVKHILKEAVDQTLHWANPAKLGGMIDESPCMCTGSAGATPCLTDGPCAMAAAANSYEGPTPIVTHVHGMEDVPDFSDGYTEAWFMPNANDLAGYTPVGTWYPTFAERYMAKTCQPYTHAGSADYIYPNTQRPSSSWFHDHTIGMTRLNVYAGLAGFYFIRKFFPEYRPGVKDTGPELPCLPYPPPGGAYNPADIRELPLAIQDRLFKKDGSLWYPVKTRDPVLDFPTGVQPPLWLPEFPFTGDLGGDFVMMTVNGRVWPKTTIKQDTYRLRLLNGCNARVLQLLFAKTANTIDEFDYTASLTFEQLPYWVIGNEAGYFPQIQGPFTTEPLTMGPADRFDVIVDFTGVSNSERVFMYNVGPEEPFKDGTAATQTAFATPFTSQLMRFDFDSKLTNRPSKTFDAQRQAKLNAALVKEAPPPLPPATRRRQMALIEENNPLDATVVKAVLLGTVPVADNGVFTAAPQLWADAVTTTTPVNTLEEWDIINLTPDAHPIHLHEVVYETVSRTAITPDANDPLKFTDTGVPVTNPFIDPLLFLNCPTGKCPAQVDVSLILPSTRTRIRFRTGPKPGLFVWHCHLVEHEDNEMMVPWCIGPPNYINPKTSTPMCPSAGLNLVPVPP